ncbi:MAG: hypothetical protein KDA89_18640, partial [Planctomycetaceae bacterium]|nr:hypothetical protein [Planctomycetaceae bacterium]
RLSDLSLADLQQACAAIDHDVFQVLGAANAMQALQTYGSGGAGPVAERVAEWQRRLADSGVDRTES